MDIRLLFVAIFATILCYIVTVTVRYYMGKWQWVVFYPGKFIFPKRISSQIRKSVLMEYKVLDSTGVTILEDRVEDDLESKKILRIDNSKISVDARIKFNEEKSFKYYLFLRQAIMIQNPNDGYLTVFKRYYKLLSELNGYFSNKYLKVGITSNARSVILADVLYNILINLEGEFPYGFDIYHQIKHKGLLESNEVPISQLKQDPVIKQMILDNRLSCPLFTHAKTTSKTELQRSIMLMILLLLLTKWQ